MSTIYIILTFSASLFLLDFYRCFDITLANTESLIIFLYFASLYFLFVTSLFYIFKVILT